MIKPSKTQLQALFSFLESQPRDFRPICRWLVLGPELAKTILPDFAHAPSLEEVLDLVRLVTRRAPELRETIGWLTAASPHAEALQDELQLDRLLEFEPDSWAHPIQILTKPRSPFVNLLEACRRRLVKAEGEDHERLSRVEEKLERAMELEERARRRRLEMRRKEELARARFEAASEDGEEVH